MFIAASGKKGIKPRRGGIFISAVAKTPSKTPKLTYGAVSNRTGHCQETAESIFLSSCKRAR